MKGLLFVFLGGGLGSVSRYLLSLALNSKHAYLPYGTFITNILGSFFIGILLALFIKHQGWSHQLRLLAAVGFCGGFTTMSSFSFEAIDFLRNGAFMPFFLYSPPSIILCFVFTYVGYILAK